MILVVRKYTGGNKFTKLLEKKNPFMYMGDIEIFIKREKELETYCWHKFSV